MTQTPPELSDDAQSGQGVLLVGHGTRDAAGLAEFRELAGKLALRLSPRPVEACYLELAEPTIAAAAARLVEQGVRRITVMPVLLFAAGHAKRDIPAAVADALASLPQVSLRQTPHLGCRPEILALSQRRMSEALTEAEMLPIPLEQTLLLMVGRGSTDDTATAEMLEFAKFRAAQAGVGGTAVAFAALAEPRLEAELERSAQLTFRRIVVQPHILFEGLLLDRIRDLVGDAARRHPTRQWLVTRHLGAEPELVECLAGLALVENSARSDE